VIFGWAHKCLTWKKPDSGYREEICAGPSSKPGGLFRVCPSTPPLPRFAFTFSMPSAFSGQRGYEPPLLAIWRPSLERQRDFNPPEPRTAQRALPVGRQSGQNRRIRALLMNVHDDARRSKEHIRGNGFNQDAGKGDGAGCDCAFFLRTAAEISVMASPIGKGSMKVISELKSGFSYCSLNFFSC
jgi:hypothetical protein